MYIPYLSAYGMLSEPNEDAASSNNTPRYHVYHNSDFSSGNLLPCPFLVTTSFAKAVWTAASVDPWLIWLSSQGKRSDSLEHKSKYQQAFNVCMSTLKLLSENSLGNGVGGSLTVIVA